MAGLFGESDTDENAVVPERDDEESGYRDPMTGRVWIVMAAHSLRHIIKPTRASAKTRVPPNENRGTKKVGRSGRKMEESSTPLLAIMGR